MQNLSHAAPSGLTDPAAEHFVPNWPATPPGRHWREVPQQRNVRPDRSQGMDLPRFRGEAQQLVQFCMNGLRVPMLRPLDKQRHQPRGDGRNRVPIEALRIE